MKFQLISCNRGEQCGKQLKRIGKYNIIYNYFWNTFGCVCWCHIYLLDSLGHQNYFGFSKYNLFMAEEDWRPASRIKVAAHKPLNGQWEVSKSCADYGWQCKTEVPRLVCCHLLKWRGNLGWPLLGSPLLASSSFSPSLTPPLSGQLQP